MKLPQKWTTEQINKLKVMYETNKKEEILNNFPGYTWRSIQNIAIFLKFKRGIITHRKGTLEPLFYKTALAHYWLGFILADGYISEDGTVKVVLSNKDKLHLEKLGEFLKCKVFEYPVAYKGTTIQTVRVKIKDLKLGRDLRTMMGIIGKKTYNPFNLDFIKGKYFLVSFLCGYIDGDGSINKKGNIAMDAHAIYNNLFKVIGESLKKNKIIKHYGVILYKEMTRLYFASKLDNINIKSLGIKLQLPLLGRKWSRIEDNYASKLILETKKGTIKKLCRKGYTLSEINQIINYKSIGSLYNFCKNNKILTQKQIHKKKLGVMSRLVHSYYHPK